MLKILVVDDEPDLAPLIRQKFRRQIRSGDFHFTMAEDGLHALECLEDNPDIDIILTDINMPRMDGLTLLSKLADREGTHKAVVVTAYGDMENIRIAMNRGAFDFLTKPIDLDDLEITISKAASVVMRERKAAMARETFGRYLSNEVVEQLLDNPDGIKLGGEKRTVTIIMSDLRGFSMISERLNPEVVVEILNIYLGRMTEVITKYGGTIDEFIGDGILTVFGAPVLIDDHAARAVACSCEMQLAMADVNAALARRNFPNLEMGIGINTGEVVVGNIGSAVRAKYGVVGSNVNLTSRIEAYTVGGQILVSERTMQETGDSIDIRDRMEVPMKGFSDPIPIFDVRGIGAPFDLSLADTNEDMTVLKNAIPCSFNALDGKHVDEKVSTGEIVRLGETGALVRTKFKLKVLSNIRLTISSEALQVPSNPDLYAKVMPYEGDESHYKIRFTAIPEEIRSGLALLAAGA